MGQPEAGCSGSVVVSLYHCVAEAVDHSDVEPGSDPVVLHAYQMPFVSSYSVSGQVWRPSGVSEKRREQLGK